MSNAVLSHTENHLQTLRNIAIIAHVDHGKTTLVDGMFKQSGVVKQSDLESQERLMDSNDLEKERGITILAKNTAIPYKDYRINILDTPGHADFSGEVERVLTMVDGVLLVVDAVEGPMPQTRFVLRKALALGLKVVVVVNKMDRPAADPARAVDKVIDLFIELGANEDQLEFPTVYACGLQGYATLDPTNMQETLEPLFETIIKEIPCPQAEAEGAFQMQVSTLDYNDYLGRIVIGRVRRGEIKPGETITRVLQADGSTQQYRVNKLFGFEGLKRMEIPLAQAGDIVALAGVNEVQIGDTLTHPGTPEALPPISLEEPTLKMTFGVNTSPLSGREGKFVTSRQLEDRLNREIKTNISLRVELGPSAESYYVSGRGELHLTILIETMRREGYEFQVGKPEVLTKQVGGQTHEPFEDVMLDVPEDSSGACIEKLCQRKGELTHLETNNGRTLLQFNMPSRGLLGFRSLFIRLTRGQGIMSSTFREYASWAGDIGNNRNGALIAHEQGDATAYAIKSLEDRGVFFINPGVVVYRGMIVGEQNRQGDLVINVCKTKKLTNMRSAGAEVLDVLNTPVDLTLEYGMDFIAMDELMEVTPQNIRLRKQDLVIK
ncbi:MAG: translational GTPase TypA [Vampirovibrionales bacterium]